MDLMRRAASPAERGQRARRLGLRADHATL